jgi:pilus assembly protein Flp/PilA
MMELFKRLLKDETGATMVEYSVMLAMIAAVVFGTVVTLGTQVQTGFQNLSTLFAAAF